MFRDRVGSNKCGLHGKDGSISSRKLIWLHTETVFKKCAVEQVRTEEKLKADKKKRETISSIYMDLKEAYVQHKVDKKLISKVRKYSENDEVFAQT